METKRLGDLLAEQEPKGSLPWINFKPAYWLTCTTVAGGKPLKYVEDAWL